MTTRTAKQQQLQDYVRSAPVIGKASIVTLATFRSLTPAGRKAMWAGLAVYQKLSIASEINSDYARDVMAELEAKFK